MAGETRGRKRIYADAAAKQAAYRQRKELALQAQEKERIALIRQARALCREVRAAAERGSVSALYVLADSDADILALLYRQFQYETGEVV